MTAGYGPTNSVGYGDRCKTIARAIEPAMARDDVARNNASSIGGSRDKAVAEQLAIKRGSYQAYVFNAT